MSPTVTDSAGVTRVEIPDVVLKRLRARAEVAYPEECCGFLFGTHDRGRVVVVDELETPNAAEPQERARRFLIDPQTLLRVMRESREGIDEVVGFYHSHPNHPAELSPTDLAFAARWPRTIWLIVPVDRGAAGTERAWWLPARDEGLDPQEVSIGRNAAETSTSEGGSWT